MRRIMHHDDRPAILPAIRGGNLYRVGEWGSLDFAPHLLPRRKLMGVPGVTISLGSALLVLVLILSEVLR